MNDALTLSHEIGEWVNDPVLSNPVPAFGNVGQVQGYCQANLEVDDPLCGVPLVVKGTNGYTYHMQELAFYSWFIGGPSIAVNGWYSNQGTFLTDAGAVCQ